MNAVLVAEKLTNLEWLTQIGLKAIEYNADPKGTGEKGPSWEDRCGAIAEMEDGEAKAYATILAWGDTRDSTEEYRLVIEYIAHYLCRMVQEDMEKHRETFNMAKFCEGIARMELFYSLRPKLREYHTLKGRLVFSGIDFIEPNTYSKRYAWLGDAVELLLKGLQDEIDISVSLYRSKLRK